MSRPDIGYYMPFVCSVIQNPSCKCYEAAQSVPPDGSTCRLSMIRYSRAFAVAEWIMNVSAGRSPGGGAERRGDGMTCNDVAVGKDT